MKRDDNIDDAYNNFENQKRLTEIKEFAQTNDIDEELIANEVSEYEFTGIINKERIRDGITKPISLLVKTKLINAIRDFIINNVEKYQ